MSKVITSPSKRWAGTVTISDPLTISQAQLIEAGMRQPETEGGRVWMSVIDGNQLPAIFACVEIWNIEGFEGITPDTFPASPRKESHEFIDWLFKQILSVYLGEAVIPNE